MTSITESSLAEFLDDIGAKSPSPAGGAVAAIVAAQAAGLAEMSGLFSDEHGAAVAREAGRLRASLTPLADADIDAYGAFLTALRLPKTDPQARAEAIAVARSHAADVPLATAEYSAAVASAVEDLVATGNPNLRADAAAAVFLAAAAATTTSIMVGENLRSTPDDPRIVRAADAALTARAAAMRVLALFPAVDSTPDAR